MNRTREQYRKSSFLFHCIPLAWKVVLHPQYQKSCFLFHFFPIYFSLLKGTWEWYCTHSIKNPIFYFILLPLFLSPGRYLGVVLHP